MRAIALGLLAVLVIGAPVVAAKPLDGIELLSQSRSGPSRYVKLIDCYVTDDRDYRTYGGSLAAGASFSLSFDFCYTDQYTMAEPPDEGVDEDIAFDLQGRGDFAISLTVETRDAGLRSLDRYWQVPEKGQWQHWQGCSYTGDRSNVTLDNGGRVTLTFTNIGSRTARDVWLNTYVDLTTDYFQALYCTP